MPELIMFNCNRPAFITYSKEEPFHVRSKVFFCKSPKKTERKEGKNFCQTTNVKKLTSKRVLRTSQQLDNDNEPAETKYVTVLREKKKRTFSKHKNA